MRGRTIAQVLALAAVYAVVARLGLAMDAVSGFATLVWPPTGIALAALFLGGTRLWPGVWLGAFAVNLSVGAPLPVAASIAVGNTLEAVLASAGLRRIGFSADLARVRDVAALIVVAALASPLVSASVGVLSLSAGGLIGAPGVWSTWWAWWIGDMLGALVVGSLLLTWGQRPAVSLQRPRAAASAAFTVLSVGAAIFIFALPLPLELAPLRQPFLLFPALVWAPLRFGPRGVTATTFLIAAIAIAGTTAGLGPFSRPHLHAGLTELQVFMAAMAMGLLVLGALVAERHRAEHALGQAVGARDEFLSIASHELRTPLSVLTLELGALQRRLDKLLISTDRSAVATRIHKTISQTERLNQLVSSLLEVSRITTGRLHIERESIELVGLVREVIDRMAEHTSKAACLLRLHADAAVNGQWDRLRVEQVVINLLSNATKYGAGKPIDVFVEATATTATLKVSDHGIGIGAEDVSRIFGRFERAVSARHFGGLGLGLYITRQIAEAHGGEIQVVSTVGQGATFIVELPLHC